MATDLKISQMTEDTPLWTAIIPFVVVWDSTNYYWLKSDFDWDTGATWNGIASIVLTGTVWLVDTYRITYTDATTYDYTVTNWEDWTDGTNWTDWTDWNGIVNITLVSSIWLVDTYQILFTDTTTTNYTVTNWSDWTDGTDGTDWNDWTDWRSIVSVIRTSWTGAAWTTDTYTITYNIAPLTSTFDVYNGADWVWSWDMLKAIYDPTNVNWDAFDRANHTWTQAETTISFTDITDNNVSTSKHWFTPKLSGNSTQFLDWQGNYSTPAWVVNSYTTTTFTAQTSIVVNHWFWAIALVQILDSWNNEVIPENIEHTSINSFTVTFNQAETWTIIASVWSPQAANLTTAPWNYTVQTWDNIIKCTWLWSTITLLTAVWIAGIEFKIDNDTLWDIFITWTGWETIQGEVTQTLPSQNSVTVYSDGTNWRVN